MKWAILILFIAAFVICVKLAWICDDLDQIYYRLNLLDIAKDKTWKKFNNIDLESEQFKRALEAVDKNASEDMKKEANQRRKDFLKLHQRIAYCENWIHLVNINQKKYRERKEKEEHGDQT